MGMVKGAFNQIQQVCMLVCDMASRSVHAPGSFAGRSHISLLQLKDAVTRHETSVDQIKGPDTSSIADASAGDETLIDKLAGTPLTHPRPFATTCRVSSSALKMQGDLPVENWHPLVWRT